MFSLQITVGKEQRLEHVMGCFYQSVSLEKRIFKRILSALYMKGCLFYFFFESYVQSVQFDPIRLPNHLLQYPPQSNLYKKKNQTNQTTVKSSFCCSHILDMRPSSGP